ncbi:substrate-binding domain-containing protein [Rhodopila sp.]|uniref:substrate-binding domain-containing protein n=1 Tax=Rhodopila sp. TaxID=2480087 RepID=UPI003D0B33CE
MNVARRKLFAVSTTALAATITSPAPVIAAGTTDLAVSCDAAVAPAVRAAGAAFRRRSGVRIRVFPTPPGLLLPQIERQIQNDIIVTQTRTIDQANRQSLIQLGSQTEPWRNRLVIAAAKPSAGPDGSFVVPDPSFGSDLDGTAILRHLGPSPATLIGVIDTGAVAWTLANGAARQGLLHNTEVVADPRLQTILPVPDDAWPPILYAASITTLARRGNPGAFIAFLASPDGQTVLQQAGLERVA